MKKITLIFALLLVNFFSKAQSYVTIPDAHFVSWLTANIPSAMTGNQMDTSNASVLSLTTMDVSNDSIIDLTGIHYFSALQNLDCSGNIIDTLTSLPDSLRSLNCSLNYLHMLGGLPSTLQTFICDRNYLTWLPSLPNSLTNFSCQENQLDTLPALPPMLPNLFCAYNLLTRLPALPNSILTIDCQTNELDSLPTLPINLTSINCQNNILTSLPSLPSTLTSIICNTNHLTTLPTLPPLLDSLECYSNLLNTLPGLPSTLTYLVCSLNPITSLPALPSSLQILKCYNDSLVALPSLPASLTYLDCNTNYLASLPSLPGALVTLNCSSNLLPAIPALPGSLETLDCSSNLLPALPALPSSLISLNCDFNSITTLPGLSSLQTLTCQHNLLTILPTLPSTLQTLSCGYNTLFNLPALASLSVLNCSTATLDSIPALPNTLTYLDCSGNLLDTLPSISASLYSLNCSYNHLTSLPTSLGSIGYLDCTNNQLTSLPTLPTSLTYLFCQSNLITCFPEFPTSITTINLYANPFTCLANYIPAMDSVTLNYPLCVYGDLVHNPNNCASAQGLVGFTYTDNNSNCIKDTADYKLINIPIKVYDGGGILLSQTYTASNGVYNFPEPAGTYTAVIDTTGVPIVPQCTSPGVDSTVTTSIAVPLISDINFDFNCKPGFDLGVRSVYHDGIAFPGTQENIRINAGDMTQWYNMHCASGVSGTVKVVISGPVHYAGVTAGALTPTITGSIYTYTIADFGAIANSSAFGLKITTDSTAAAGNTISISVLITPIGGDNDSTNNYYAISYNVVNSHDPNFKETFPKVVNSDFEDYFTYTIHFQNSGTAAARNIHISDTLDSNLDLSTFQLMDFSHDNITSLTGNILTVSFPNIMLPDSSSNADSSKGFVQYRIKSLPHRPMGTHIYNTGYIYFDFNSAIITNTTVNTYEGISGITENNSNAELSVFPNPSNGIYNVKLSKEVNASIEVYNLMGELLLNTKTQNAITQIDLSNQPKGVYIIKVITDKESFNQRLIKQ